MTVRFIVNGRPQPKQRPRFSHKTGAVYTPSKTHQYEKNVRGEYMDAHKGMVSENGPILAIVECYFPIPKSATKRLRERMLSGLRPINRRSGDADNLAKSILDALNGVAFTDDSQVVTLISEKRYVDDADLDTYASVLLTTDFDLTKHIILDNGTNKIYLR